MSDPHENPMGAAAASRPVQERQPRRVLHVDGNGEAALVLAALLSPETEVVYAATLAAAKAALALDAYALLVLDPELPDGDGAVLFETLRTGAAPPPVLLYSARPALWRDQASAFLLKPATPPRQLRAVAARLLGLAPAGEGA